MMGRFHKDSSLDRATCLKEARDRRSRYLADMEKRDQDQERTSGSQHQQQREMYDEQLQAAGAGAGAGAGADAGTSDHMAIHLVGSTAGSPSRGGSRSSPMFHCPSTRSPRPKRPSTTPARAKSPTRLGVNGPSSKENRQSATERAARIYRAGAGPIDDRRRPRSPTRGGVDGGVFKPQPPWDDRIPPNSPPERGTPRSSPREHGRNLLLWPSDERHIMGREQALPEVPQYGGLAAGNSACLSDWRRRPSRPATTSGGPSKRFSRPISAYSGRWDKDESFPEEPPANNFSEACEAKHELSDNVNTFGEIPAAAAAAMQEDAPRSPSNGRDCSPPLGGSPRARSAQEMPAIQRARHLELKRLAIEKKELEAQLAEVKKLMRARKARPNAALIGLLDRAAGAASLKHRRERLTRRRRKKRGRKPSRPSTAPSSEDAGVAQGALTETQQRPFRGQGEEEPFDASAEGRIAVNGARISSSPSRAAGGGRRRAARRRRKGSGEQGRETRRRQHKGHVTRWGSPDPNPERRRRMASGHAGKKAVAFNTTVPAEGPSTAGVVPRNTSPRGRGTDSGREGSPARRLQRTKSASRRSRSAPSSSTNMATGLPTTPDSGETKKGLLVHQAKHGTRQGGRRKGRGEKTSTRADGYNPITGENDDPKHHERRRVYFSNFPIKGNRSSAAGDSRFERKGGVRSASMSPPRIRNSGERLIQRGNSHATTSTSYLDDGSYANENAAIKDSANYYEDDFEVVSARGSYESDFEPWGNSKSDVELRTQSESVESNVTASKGKQVLALTRVHRSPRVDASVDREKQQDVRDRQFLSDSDEMSGDTCCEPSGDGLLLNGENWGDGRHRPATASRVINGGAASWKEWNQPDNEPRGLSLSDRWDTSLPKAAAQHDGSFEGNADSVTGFDYLWVEDCEHTTVRSAEHKAEDMGGSCSLEDTHSEQLESARDFSSEDSASILEGKPPQPYSQTTDDGKKVKLEFHEKNREEERVSTASLSDGGESLYDILVSSHDESGSDETWSLESFSRRHDVTVTRSTAEAGARTFPEVYPLPGSKPLLPGSVCLGSPVNVGIVDSTVRVSSDGSSLYDVTSRTSDADENISLGGRNDLPPRQLGDETAQRRSANRDPVDAVGLVGFAQGAISVRSLRDARTNSSDVIAKTIAMESASFDRAEESLPASSVPLSDHISISFRPASFDEVTGKKPACKGPLPQRPFTGDTGALRHRVGGDDEYSIDESGGSSTNGLANHVKGSDSKKHVTDKTSCDETSTGDQMSKVSAGSADEGHKRDYRHNDEVKSAHDQGAALGRGYGSGSKPGPEESLDQLSSLGEQGETEKDYRSSEGRRLSTDASGLSARLGEPSVDEENKRAAAGLEQGRNHVVDGSQLEAEDSLDELSSLEKRGESLTEQSTREAFEEQDQAFLGTRRLSSEGARSSVGAGGAFAGTGVLYVGGDLTRGAPSVEEGPSLVVEGNQLDAEGSLDELSSLEKQSESRSEQFTGEAFAQAEDLPVVEDQPLGTSDTRGIGGGTVESNRLLDLPEESLDELSSLDNQGELHKDDNLGTSTLSGVGENTSVDARGVFAEADGLSSKMNGTRRAPSVGEGQNRVHEAEGSFDELSSLGRQGEPRTEQSMGEILSLQEKRSVVENGNRSMNSTSASAGCAAQSSQLALEESLDELSSLGKQGGPYKDEELGTRTLSSEGGKSSVDAGGAFAGAGGLNTGEDRNRRAPIVEESPSRVVEGSQLDTGGSLDELSSLEKQGESRSTGEVFAQAEEPPVIKTGSHSISNRGVGVGCALHSNQMTPEESLDELSSLDKQGERYKDDNLGELFGEGGRQSVDAQSSFDESINRGAPSAAGGVLTVNSSQLAPEESLDELSSLDRQGDHYKDGQLDRLSGEGRRSSADACGPSARVRQPSAEENLNRGIPSAEGGENSLDEYLFDSGGGSPFGDLPSVEENLYGVGRSRGFENAVNGDEPSSTEKHSLDESLSGPSTTDDGKSLLYDAVSLTGSAVSDGQPSSFDGSLSEDVLV
ncbi:unnamed protein product, partial [Hapterophycus canaliculatus]